MVKNQAHRAGSLVQKAWRCKVRNDGSVQPRIGNAHWAYNLRHRRRTFPSRGVSRSSQNVASMCLHRLPAVSACTYNQDTSPRASPSPQQQVSRSAHVLRQIRRSRARPSFSTGHPACSLFSTSQVMGGKKEPMIGRERKHSSDAVHDPWWVPSQMMNTS